MTTAEQREPLVDVLPPEEAGARRPLPPPEDLEVPDIHDEDWAAFEQALAERCPHPPAPSCSTRW